MTKKLLVFCGGHLIGGQEIVTLSYLNEFVKIGIQIHCITNGWGNGDFEKRLKDLKIPFTRVKLGFIYPRKLSWTMDTFINFPKALKKIKKIISVFQPNAYYHTSYRSIYMLQNFLNIKHILHIHENVPSTLFNKHILKSIEKNTKKIIAVSRTCKNYLINCGIQESNVVILYNGTQIIQASEYDSFHSNYNFGLVGKISAYKGHEVVLEAIAILNKRNIPFVLKIFGQGEEEYVSFLKKKIKIYGLEDCTKWMGFRENLDDIYDTINVLILPTLTIEPFGMGILEAGIRNIPTIASNEGGPKEIIDHNYNGWLFEKGDSVDLANKLQSIINQEFDFQKLIKNNYNLISAKFDIRNQALHLKSLLFD